MRHGAAARCGRPAKRRAPGPRMRTRRFLHLAAHRLTAPRPLTRPRAARLPPLPRLTGAVGLRCSAQTRSSPDCVAPYRPVHRPTAPRLLSRPRVARLPPLPRLTANRLTAPRRNRVADNGLYFSLGTRPARRLRLTAPRPLIQPRRRSLAPLPHPTANRLTAPRRNRVADDGLYSFVGYEARTSPDCTTSAQPPARRSLAPRFHA